MTISYLYERKVFNKGTVSIDMIELWQIALWILTMIIIYQLTEIPSTRRKIKILDNNIKLSLQRDAQIRIQSGLEPVIITNSMTFRR